MVVGGNSGEMCGVTVFDPLRMAGTVYCETLTRNSNLIVSCIRLKEVCQILPETPLHIQGHVVLPLPIKISVQIVLLGLFSPSEFLPNFHFLF